MEKRALFAYDTKRILLEDGINTLAFGHKEITHDVEEVEITNPGADQLMSDKEARRVGLLWSRRPGAVNRIGFDPANEGEESDVAALGAGRDMRSHLRAFINQVPDEPDRPIPQEDRPILHRREVNEESPARPRNRVRMMTDSGDEEDTERHESATVAKHPESSTSSTSGSGPSALSDSMDAIFDSV